MEKYEISQIEKEAQHFWETNKSFEVKIDKSKEKFYCLSMFPYPSGQLHMGHVRNYTLGDVISRYQRMLGKNVLQPMGWDAFGLPAENAAIKNHIAPQDWTRQNVRYMKDQLKQLGFAYDWSREINTSDPSYYKWEQWFFGQLLEKGLAYRKDAWVNWDPVDKTVLANEQVIDGKGWRSGATVERKRIPQWFLRITDYADALLDDLDALQDWPQQAKQMQSNWIGRSKGLEIDFELINYDTADDTRSIRVFTTRPDTLMGATYIALAAEHPLIEALLKQSDKAKGLKDFVTKCAQQSTAESDIATGDKLGIDTGLRVRHPLSGEELPVWCANFVLMEYGFGAIMSVPAHDQRDWEFAKAYQLPIKTVIRSLQNEPNITTDVFTEKGVIFNSGKYDGMDFNQAFDVIAEDLGDKASVTTNYRLRDWGISRQRYWGAPIPIEWIGETFESVAELPVELPDQPDITQGILPLAEIDDFVHSGRQKNGKEVLRETDTFDTFFESSWYYARFCCPNDDERMINQQDADYWLPVDQYIGGIEHAVLHLLYARFFHKLMADSNLVQGKEPFVRLLAQGMVLKDGAKMSKSKGNTVNPDELITKYGADALRLFILFASPPKRSLEWSDSGVEGASRFLKRLWTITLEHYQSTADKEKATDSKALRNLQRQTHQFIIKAADDFSRQAFNTAIASAMELLNALSKFDDRSPDCHQMKSESLETLIKILAPIVPHITHALWSRIGKQTLLIDEIWPLADKQMAQEDCCRIVIQVNGKLRGHIEVAPGNEEQKIIELAYQQKKVLPYIDGKEIIKTVYVKDKLLNFVAR